MNSTSQQLKPAQHIETKPARFVISALVEGFPVSIEVEGKAEALRQVIDRLKAIGAIPPQAKASTATTEKAGTPVCPKHHTPMKEGRRGFFCPKKVGDGYCKEVA